MTMQEYASIKYKKIDKFINQCKFKDDYLYQEEWDYLFYNYLDRIEEPKEIDKNI